MYRLITILAALHIALFSFAQEPSLKEIDSTTYQMYLEQRWKDMIKYVKSIKEDNVDYYYHNIRLGMAYYYEQQYYSAEKYLLKAQKLENNDFVKKYLLWTYLWLGDNFKADKLYNELSEKTKELTGYKSKALQNIYLEGGTKSLAQEDKSSVIYYGNISLGHRLGKKFNFQHTFNTYYQSGDRTKYSHNQYAGKLNIPIKTNALGIGGIYGKTENEIKFLHSNQLETYYIKTTIGGHIDYTKRIKRLTTNINLTYLCTKTDSAYRIPRPIADPRRLPPPPIKIDKVSKINTYISSLSFYYVPRVLNERIGLGLDNYFIFAENNSFYTYKPYTNIFFTNKIWLNLNYIPIGNYILLDKTTGILYDDIKYSINRYGATINFFLFSKTTINLTYLFEEISNRNIKTGSNIKSFYLGVLYKF